MRSFSQRKGIKAVKTVIQVDSMDSDLRNGLWNALTIFYWHKVKPTSMRIYLLSNHANIKMKTLFEQLWLFYFKRPLDTLNDRWSATYDETREYFFACDWNEVYDFMEFVANSHPDDSLNERFMEYCDDVLESEVSAYRFVAGKIMQITSEEEIAEIEEALGLPEPFRPVANHLKTALDRLADRESPDYRNSIKESISAVEAICRLIADNPKATLGEALKEIEKKGKVDLHTALKRAFDHLYGYTSDVARHALLGEPNLYFEDAKFMLVSCSAFVNYLIAKSSKAGIQF